MLKGSSVSLELFSAEDLLWYFNAINSGLFSSFYLNPNFRSLMSLQQSFDKTLGFWTEDFGSLIIKANKGEEPLGVVTFFKPEMPIIGYEVGIIIFDNGNRHKGVGTEALHLFCNYLFTIKDINRLQATTSRENKVMQKVLNKCGFIEEGCFREAAFARGKYHDVLRYGLLRADMEPT